MFSVLCILCFCVVLCIVSPFVYSCLYPIFVQVYRQLPPGGNPNAVNKYHIISIFVTMFRGLLLLSSSGEIVVIVLRNLMLPFHIDATGDRWDRTLAS